VSNNTTSCMCGWIYSKGACCQNDGSACWKPCCNLIGCGGGCCPFEKKLTEEIIGLKLQY
jgi:hypothetical protein